MARLSGIKLRKHAEGEAEVVGLGKGRVLNPSQMTFDLSPLVHNDTFVVRTLRLDAIVDENPEGYTRSFAYLIAGTRVTLLAGADRFGPWTFQAGVLSHGVVEPEVMTADLPNIRHGIVGPLIKDVTVGQRHRLEMALSYEGPPVLLAFMRIVVLGPATRDLQ